MNLQTKPPASENILKTMMGESFIQLFGQLPEVFFYVKDRESCFVQVNQQVLSLYDLSDARDVLGKNDRDFHPPALANAYIAEDQKVLREGKAVTGQLWLVPHIRGTPQWFVSSKVPLRDAEGRVIGLAGAMFRVESPADENRYLGRLKPALEYLEKNFAGNISLRAAAKLCGLSTTSFNRHFRSLLRMSPTEYLLSWRIEAARRQLARTEHSLVQVAINCGFVDQSHFTKRFRRITGLTPMAYRKRFRVTK